ncbi:WD repeat-containing protein on Y chromosome-like isoform X2 [Lytechinus variegatus]|uniref:WD repeat-containing protein on Y chromosome-like isoform X2 n=1 Tax=Lytechinus variegatus TaxID=7654 RepID=UPI001BB107B1|nr:WD repeat-containing protein on Y chromosome-like isoform X2 [Lytechinus variegatus]
MYLGSNSHTPDPRGGGGGGGAGWRGRSSRMTARSSYVSDDDSNDSDSDSQGSKTSMSGKQEMGARLEDEMNNDHLQKLQEIFEEADEDGGGGLDIDEFRGAMRKIMGEGMDEVDDKELAIVFMKVDANCDGTVDWDEYLSYMLLEYQERDHMSNLFKDIPFPKPLKNIPSNHRDMIAKIGFYQTINLRHGGIADEGEHNGRHISVSKEGIINFWNMEMNLIKSVTLELPREKTKPMWLTDMICMPNVNMIAISSTEREISFFDVNASKCDKCFQVAGLEHCALTMDYWFDPRNMNKAVLVFGDAGGGVYCIVFQEALGSALFGSQNAKSVGSRRVPFQELLKGLVKGIQVLKFSPLHEDWVRKVKYCCNLNSFVSCATTNDTSIFIGDLDRKKSGSFFKIRKGILCFDYDKDSNVIVTGGMDRSVRTWNPYVTTKATSVMKGHTSAVVHVVVNTQHGQIISVGKDKGIKVWDMRDQTCLQNINPRNINLGPHAISSICFHAKTGSLILGTNQLALLEHKWEVEGDEDEMTSHNRPITHCLYNSLFNQVVSGCHDSVVCVWDLATGTKTIQFSNAHKYMEKGVEKSAEITAMTFDPSGRRLVTGGRNGTVKIWNFNNGACLRELETFDNLEVTGISCPKQRIVTAGWNKRITSYIDSDDDEDTRQWALKHNEDILSLACSNTSRSLATSSYDGDIWVWSLETTHPLCKLNAFEGVKPQTGSRMLSVSRETSFHTNGDTSVYSSSSSRLPTTRCSSRDKLNGEGVQENGDNIGLSDDIAKLSVSNDEDEKTKLPAIDPQKVGLIQERAANLKEESQTFFTESIGPRTKDSRQKNETETREKENAKNAKGKERRERDQSDRPKRESSYCLGAKNKEDYVRKHEASVDKLLFLQSRTNDKDTATLMASGSEGWVRAWSIHHKGGLLGQFNAAHKPGESVLAMATDTENEILITADTLGYVKVWDISEYCIGKREMARRERENIKVDYSEREKEYPYLSGNSTLKRLSLRKEMRSRANMKQPPPQSNPKDTLLFPPKLNSFRAHLKGITYVDYAEDKHLIITGSIDCSIRLWTVCGRYIGTFGQKGGWPKLPDEIDPRSLSRVMPRDVQRVASAVTLKVLNGGNNPRWKLAKTIMMVVGRKQIRQDEFEDSNSNSDGVDDIEQAEEKRQSSWGTSSILGKSYKPKTRHKMPPILPDIKHNQSQVMVYSSLPFTNLTPVKDPTVPATLQEIQLRHQSSDDTMNNQLVGGPAGQLKRGGKKSRLHEFIQKHRAVKLMQKRGSKQAQTK